jgi:hypothetical protein
MNPDESDYMSQLEAENADLKQRLEKLQEENYSYESQLADIKYLDEKKVEKIVLEFFNFNKTPSGAITAICNIAIDKVFNADKIVEDIINKIVIASHDVHIGGNHYKYVLDDIGLVDIKQNIQEIINSLGGK